VRCDGGRATASSGDELRGRSVVQRWAIGHASLDGGGVVGGRGEGLPAVDGSVAGGVRIGGGGVSEEKVEEEAEWVPVAGEIREAVHVAVVGAGVTR
jgi:hypothetical protein